MNVYLDASVLVSMFTVQSFSSRADAFVRSRPVVPILSDFAAAEFASAISKLTRIGEITEGYARIAFSNFDIWADRASEKIQTESTDIGAAEAFLRRLDLNLRAADAIHIAVAGRLTASLATFDAKMADCAKALKVAVVDL